MFEVEPVENYKDWFSFNIFFLYDGHQFTYVGSWNTVVFLRKTNSVWAETEKHYKYHYKRNKT